MSTMDNASAQLAIALQLHDLDELEASGTVEEYVIRIQRQQLEVDSGFDATTFEASRRLALSMAKAVEEDSFLLSQSTHLSQIDDAAFHRLASLNHSPSIPSKSIEPTPRPDGNCTESTLPSTAKSKKRVRSVTPEVETSSALGNSNRPEISSDCHAGRPCKKAKGEKTTARQNRRNQLDSSGNSQVQEPQTFSADASSAQMMSRTEPTTANETSLSIADCASCSDHLTLDKLIKAPCDHYYCNDCFGLFIEASLQTHDGFPPKCCKIPIAFDTVAKNVSAPIFSRYTARQAEIKNATALYCGIQRCGVKIENYRIDGIRGTCEACGRDTCTLCRSEFPRKVNGKNVGHVCKKDRAREQVLELARKEGWQTCYQCGNLVALNFGCHHMRCRCDTEFCYRCGTKWKNCECGDYHMPHLETRAVIGMGLRARRRVARGLPPDPRPREIQLAELQQRLQVDCDHNNFLYEVKTEMNPGRCQICEYYGWKFILRCDSCRFTACRNCHRFFGWDGGEDPFQNVVYGFGNYDDETDDETDDGSVSEAESVQSQDVPREELNSDLQPSDGMPKPSRALEYFLEQE